MLTREARRRSRIRRSGSRAYSLRVATSTFFYHKLIWPDCQFLWRQGASRQMSLAETGSLAPRAGRPMPRWPKAATVSTQRAASIRRRWPGREFAWSPTALERSDGYPLADRPHLDSHSGAAGRCKRNRVDFRRMIVHLCGPSTESNDLVLNALSSGSHPRRRFGPSLVMRAHRQRRARIEAEGNVPRSRWIKAPRWLLFSIVASRRYRATALPDRAFRCIVTRASWARRHCPLARRGVARSRATIRWPLSDRFSTLKPTAAGGGSAHLFAAA